MTLASVDAASLESAPGAATPGDTAPAAGAALTTADPAAPSENSAQSTPTAPAAPAAPTTAAPRAARPTTVAPAVSPAGPATPRRAADPHVSRLLRIRVPVIARLALRTMPIRTVRALSPGSIVEFARSVETPVEVLINNHVIALAEVVKVGELFGLRITQIADRAQRIQSFHP